MINKNSLKHCIMALRFAIWDLHLYLDTHCSDAQAMELMKKYEEKYKELLEDYVSRYGPITFTQGTPQQWVGCPFPWEITGSEC